MSTLTQYQKAIEALSEHEDIILISHINPDGDNLGSLVGMALGLTQLGKRVTIINHDNTPQKLKFLTELYPVTVCQDLNNFSGKIITLDCTEWRRTGFDVLPDNLSIIMNIDHHVSNLYFAKVNLVDTAAAATGEIVYKLLQQMGVTFTPQLSTALYTALMTDTGSFRFSNTTPFTLETAAVLLGNGADTETINISIYETSSLGYIRFLAAALNVLEISKEGKIAWIGISSKMMDEHGVSVEECENLVNYAKTINGVEVAFLVKETQDNKLKVSFRSKGALDVNKIAAEFGGGGHQRAAGCIVADTQMETLINDILNTVNKQLK